MFKTPFFCANNLFLMNNTHKLFWHSNINKPKMKNFDFMVTQLSEIEIQQSSELM